MSFRTFKELASDQEESLSRQIGMFSTFSSFSHSPENRFPMKALYIPQGDLPTPPVVYYMTLAALRPEGFEKRGKITPHREKKSPTCLCFQFTFCYLFWISIFYQPYVWFFKRLQPPSSFFHCKSQWVTFYCPLSSRLSCLLFTSLSLFIWKTRCVILCK